MHHCLLISACCLLFHVNKELVGFSFLVFVIILYVFNEVYFGNPIRIKQVLSIVLGRFAFLYFLIYLVCLSIASYIVLSKWMSNTI